MNRRAKLIVAISLLVTLAYIVFSQYQLDAERKDSVSTYSSNGKGMSLYAALMEKLPYASGKVYRRPLIYFEDLSAMSGVGIFSPRLPLSEKEAQTLKAYLEFGGKVVLSAHDEDSLKRLYPLLSLVNTGSSIGVSKHEDFENYLSQSIVSDFSDELFVKEGVYSFYSSIYFSNRPACANEKEVSCYYYSQQVGQGLLFLFLGLPPNSNALIYKGGNSELSFRMARFIPKIYFDEYHHLFPTKSMADLAFDLKYSLPLLGVFLGALLFFVFGKNPKPRIVEDRNGTKSLHDIGQNLLIYYMDQTSVLDGARKLYGKYLERKYPRHKEEIRSQALKPPFISNDEKKRIQINSKDLIELHQRLIAKKKGVKKNDLHPSDRQPNL